jgi:hypothetical protein
VNTEEMVGTGSSSLRKKQWLQLKKKKNQNLETVKPKSERYTEKTGWFTVFIQNLVENRKIAQFSRKRLGFLFSFLKFGKLKIVSKIDRFFLLLPFSVN